MRTTFKEQIDAIAKMMLSRSRKVKRNGGEPNQDHTWIALNDAASSIASLNMKVADENN